MDTYLQHHRDVLKTRAVILSRIGNTQEEIAKQLDRDQKTVSNWLGENHKQDFLLSEELLQEAIEQWEPNDELIEVVEDLREERIFGHWSDEERTLLDAIREGKTIIVSLAGTKIARGGGTGTWISRRSMRIASKALREGQEG